MTAFFESRPDGDHGRQPVHPRRRAANTSQGPEAGPIAYAQIGLPRDITLEEATAIGAELKELMPKIEGVHRHRGTILAEFEVPSSELLGLASP